MADNERRRVVSRAVEVCLRGEVDALPEIFTADVSGWSPNMLVSSLEELSESVADKEDALSDVTIHVDALDVVGNKGFMEYRVTAAFTGPFVIDDETTIEPNGRDLLIGAVLVAEFKEDKISSFRNYFDDATLMEQMLAS